MKDIGVGIIGFGMAGQFFHAPIIASVDGFAIRSVRTTNRDRIAAARKTVPGVNIVTKTTDILEDPTIQLVIVATPNEYHFELTKEALESDKDVVVDKPFTIASSQATELVRRAAETHRLVAPYHNRRWDGDIRTARDLIASGKLGRIVEAELHFDRFRNRVKDNWRETSVPGSGMLYDLGPHLIDQAIYLFGLPSTVSADVKSQRRAGAVPDYFDIHLGYDNGLKVILKSSMLVTIAGPRLQIHGDHGSFVKYGMDVQEHNLRAGVVPRDDPHWGEEAQESWGEIAYVHGTATTREKVPTVPGDYRLFYKNLYEAITQGRALVVDPMDACHNIRIIESAMESSRMGTTVAYEL